MHDILLVRAIILVMPVKQAVQSTPSFALFNLGFRPFFLLASVLSVVSIWTWGASYIYGWTMLPLPFSAASFHAHEMIFGYGMAVVAGFLLTAVRNWTHLTTLQGRALFGLTALWLAARLSGYLMASHILPMMLFDMCFDLGLIVAITRPIVRAKQKQQSGIIAKLALLWLANLCFYLGALGILDQGIMWGLNSGIYLLLALIFNLARRVLPFFIERGVGYPVQIKNRVWIDRSSLYLLTLLWIADVFWGNAFVSSALALMLFVIHAIRLMDWHTRGIWEKPLLWILFLGYAGATFGFLLKALTPFLALSPFLSLHAFALGGIGMMTMGMMARISLGHTGRDIQQHSRWLTPIFILLIAAFIARVLLPMLDPAHYRIWLGMAQATWLIAFILFAWVYAPILIKPRADGQFG